MLRSTGRRLDRSTPFVDASLADGSRLHVVIPDITKSNWSINVRKFPERIIDLQELVASKTLTIEQQTTLVNAVRDGKNILVSGATQSGKTTLLCALLNEISSNQRIISVEETFELKIMKPDWVAMQTRQANLEGIGEVTLRRLIKEALRMRPNRLIVGEVREAESLDLLIALNSGLPGACTIHANSARDAILKLCTLPLLAGQNISSDFVNPTVGNAIDLVVHCTLNADGTRVVSEILEVSWNSLLKQIEFSKLVTI
jgi:pilus assembly protein CpaF